ncbi:MAG TPA: glutamate--tRNA ligase [Patescibacteria group bacterium]
MVRTRFAPSPTGNIHIGGLRTALYAYALAKHNKGEFILRIEDTDKKREVEGATEKIKELLNLFGLIWDEYFIQSERVKSGIYKKAAEKLVKEGHAYYCQHEGRNAKKEGFSKELRDSCRDKNLTSGAIKLRVPDNEKVSFKDFVVGKEISWNTSDVADATLLKSDGFPTYHLAVVVDDNDMKVSHVLRGHDWMPSTPIHLLVHKYLGFKLPEIGHLTDILDPEGGKLSKRKGSTSVEGLLKEGYLPSALLNYVCLLGWAPKNNQEIFSLEEFVAMFDPKGFQKSNPVFDRAKLDWMNGEYIRKADLEGFIRMLKSESSGFSEELLKKIAPLIKDRIKKLSEFGNYTRFFIEEPTVEKKLLGPNSKKHLEAAKKALDKIKKWDLEEINEVLMEAVKDNGFKIGDFFMDLRIAVTGTRFTPPINDSIVILGKDTTLKRLSKVT